MKKRFKAFVLATMVVFALVAAAVCVSADTGPKPSITIKTNGTVGEKYYLDLLIECDNGYPNLKDAEIA